MLSVSDGEDRNNPNLHRKHCENNAIKPLRLLKYCDISWVIIPQPLSIKYPV